MNGIRLVALVLVVAGILAVVYRGFDYTKDTTVAKIGPIELNAKKTETVDIPLWAGIGAIVLGGVLFVMGRKG